MWRICDAFKSLAILRHNFGSNVHNESNDIFRRTLLLVGLGPGISGE
jgi:hypothetical protein